MRRRLLVAKALVHRPPVIILDEPTAGVDVELRRSLWRYMRELNAGGVTVVLTTHYLEEAEQLCDRIAILDRGHLVAADEKERLMHRLDEKELWVTLAKPVAALPPSLLELGASLDERGRITFRYRPSRARIGDLLDRVRDAGLVITDLATREADLEELFLRLTGGGTARPPGEPALDGIGEHAI
jgi:ABC-2 type transport system ATP-binding protein